MTTHAQECATVTRQVPEQVCATTTEQQWWPWQQQAGRAPYGAHARLGAVRIPSRWRGAHVTSDCHLPYAGLSPVNIAAELSRLTGAGASLVDSQWQPGTSGLGLASNFACTDHLPSGAFAKKKRSRKAQP